MTNAISLFARYNDHVDRKLFSLLDEVDPELLRSDAGAYFGSIIGVLNHILTSHLGWLVRFRDGGIASQALMNPALQFEHPGFRKILHADYGTLKAHQLEVDAVILGLAAELTGTNARGPGIGQVFAYASTRGDEHRFRVGEMLLQILNHATHHRGQISQILDHQGIEHDYSSLMPLFEEPSAI